NLKKVLELAPAHLNARYLLMNIYNDQEEFDKLALLANETWQIAPNDQQTLTYINLSKNRKTRLASALEKANSEPTPENFLDLSLRYYQAEQYQNCIDAAREAIKLKPDYPEAYNNICACYNGMKMWDEAIAAGEIAVKLNSGYQLAINNLAWAKSQKKESLQQQ
ncbi:MAG: hypothetical protein AB1489_15660, partial [Acidobacteriota bacterium]